MSDSRPILHGRPVAPGVAMGTAVIVYALMDLSTIPERQVSDVISEQQRFHVALEQVQQDLQQLSTSVLPEAQQLLQAYIHILSDSNICTQISAYILAGCWAPTAIRKTIQPYVMAFEAMEDAYLQARSMDLRDLGQRLLAQLQPTNRQQADYPDATILIGEDITPATFVSVPVDKLVGIISAQGTEHNHVAILARAMGIPAIMGVVYDLQGIDRQPLLLDGFTGEVYLSPSADLCAQYHPAAVPTMALPPVLPTHTLDGTRIYLHGNAGLSLDIQATLQVGVEGIGLYRTEVYFMTQLNFPTEALQEAHYQSILASLSPLPVVMRTLDIGGDKALPYFSIDEKNACLGWRGLRVCLDNPEIFKTQLRALLRANQGQGNLQLMLPMVTHLYEVKMARAMLLEVCQAYALPCPPLGIMVEVPALLYQIPAIADEVDFFSIGSNDLVQYLLAADRNNPQVAGIYDPLHPCVLQALASLIHAINLTGKPLSLCGEMASDPVAVILLLAMGLNTLSIPPQAAARMRSCISQISLPDAQRCLVVALQQTDATAVRTLPLLQSLSRSCFV